MEQTFKGVKYMFFWNGIFSNWYESHFEVNGVKYNCGEQYMMHQKAMTFNDKEIANKILREYSPNPKLKRYLLKYKDFQIVEASPVHLLVN